MYEEHHKEIDKKKKKKIKMENQILNYVIVHCTRKKNFRSLEKILGLQRNQKAQK